MNALFLLLLTVPCFAQTKTTTQDYGAAFPPANIGTGALPGGIAVPNSDLAISSIAPAWIQPGALPGGIAIPGSDIAISSVAPAWINPGALPSGIAIPNSDLAISSIAPAWIQPGALPGGIAIPVGDIVLSSVAALSGANFTGSVAVNGANSYLTAQSSVNFNGTLYANTIHWADGSTSTTSANGGGGGGGGGSSVYLASATISGTFTSSGAGISVAISGSTMTFTVGAGGCAQFTLSGLCKNSASGYCICAAVVDSSNFWGGAAANGDGNWQTQSGLGTGYEPFTGPQTDCGLSVGSHTTFLSCKATAAGTGTFSDTSNNNTETGFQVLSGF